MIFKLLVSTGLIAMTLSTPSQAADTAVKLAPCPNTPNCVSSQAPKDSGHYIAPFKIKGKVEDAWAALQRTLAGQKRTVITEAGNGALHAEATTLVFRFVDDVDAVLDADAKLIHIRSASRVGYSDLGVNRRRMEALRRQLQQAGIVE
ncbi:DUF1499 domain-containing protein [Methylosarcina fibrata]|uniref:DUF1499 domain-containing protein n=1 Tax=Methylosarcina fibrata TaxID=105972 RepID=UPI000381E9B0|nr:DUF1499 domain-containing protein [Methylosarcina fibrata]